MYIHIPADAETMHRLPYTTKDNYFHRLVCKCVQTFLNIWLIFAEFFKNVFEIHFHVEGGGGVGDFFLLEMM